MKQHTRTTDDDLRIVRELQAGQRRPLDTSPVHIQAKRKEFKRTPQPDSPRRVGGYFYFGHYDESPGLSSPYTNQRKRRKRARQNG